MSDNRLRNVKFPKQGRDLTMLGAASVGGGSVLDDEVLEILGTTCPICSKARLKGVWINKQTVRWSIMTPAGTPSASSLTPLHNLRNLLKRSLSQESAMEGYQDPVYDETLQEKIPEQFREYTLDKLVHNRMEIEHFKTFLSENFADMDLMCWMDIEAFRRITHTEQRRRDMKAKDIRLKYLNKKYFFGATSPAGKEGQDKVMEAGGGWGKLLDDRPPTGLLLEAQKYVASRLEKKWLPMFLATEEFCERQNPRSSLGDVAEDLLLMKRRKSTQVWKILESRWVSSSKDIISFRKALLNPVTCLQFRRYVSIKGDSLENDVLFWQEVQRYKTLCHANSDRSLINQKIAAIINTFIDSQIPPALQIDIPSEQAEKIIEKRLEAAPYIFREAQLTVFRVLFSHWSEFCTYRANLAEDRILPTIERQRRRAKQKEKEQQRKMQAQHDKEMARRRAAGLPTGGKDDEEDDYNPFKDLTREDGEESDSEMRNNKEGVMWTYSQYVNTLVEENNTNTADERTLSSLADTESMKDVKTDYEAEEVQLKPVANGTKTDKKKQADSKIQKKSDRRIQIQQPPFEKAKVLDTERGKGVERGRKTKEKTAQDKKIDPTQTKTETASKKTASTHSTARGMPPLVKKR